ncbi:MAG: DUF1684 domain-containing protein [Bacteroidota bacterium]
MNKKNCNLIKTDLSANIRLISACPLFFRRVIRVLFLAVLLYGCSNDYSPEQKVYIAEIESIRKEKNDWMRDNPDSPFNYKGKVAFHELNYFDVDPEFLFKSKLYEYELKDTITIFGTKGELRSTVRFGYVKFNYKGTEYKINVYEGRVSENEVHYSIWFTDETTNKESYGVGRYINFEKNADPNFIYDIDFNLAYNPYCAYSPNYSCAIPTKDDNIKLAINAGEKKFHN